MLPGSDESPIRVLIAMQDPREGEQVKEYAHLARGHLVEVVKVDNNGSACLIDAHLEPHPDVIIAEDHLPGENGTNIAAKLRTELPWISVVVLTSNAENFRPAAADQAVADAMLAGAAGCLRKPVSPPDYANLWAIAVRAGKAARARKVALYNAVQTGSGGGCVVVVYGPKGGVGRTVIAAKLAYLLAQPEDGKTPPRVALCELGVPMGDLTPLLGVDSPPTLLPLIQHKAFSNEDLLSNMYKLPKRENLQVLFAPRLEPEQGRLTDTHVSAIVLGLRAEFNYVVIDTGAGCSAVTLQALRSAQQHVLVTTPDLLGFDDARFIYGGVKTLHKETRVLINRYHKSSSYKVDKITDYIQATDGSVKDTYLIEDQPRSMRYALDSGELLRLDDKKALDFTEKLHQLSSDIKNSWAKATSEPVPTVTARRR